MAEEDRKPAPEIDSSMVKDLLEIVRDTSSLTDLRAINETARMHLAQINADLENELRPPVEKVEEPGVDTEEAA